MPQARHTSSVATRSPHDLRQVDRPEAMRKLIFKPSSTAKATLKTLMEALASNNPVERNSAINNHVAGQAVWHAHGITIQGAARIKHFLSALGMFNLNNNPVRVPLTEIEWDALSTTARIHTIRRVRPILLPFVEFAIPVDTILVFNADSEPITAMPPLRQRLTALPVGGPRAPPPPEESTIQSLGPDEEAPALFITKWEEQWPIDSILINLPWPLTIYAAVVRTLLMPLLVMLLIAWAELLFNIHERVRNLSHVGGRAISHISRWTSTATEAAGHQIQHYFPSLYHYPPRSLPSPRRAADATISAALTLLYGPARVLESSAQLTTETLNTFLPASAQLPSPRILEWYEEQHARSLKRQKAIHISRIRASSPRLRQTSQGTTHTAALAGTSSLSEDVPSIASVPKAPEITSRKSESHFRSSSTSPTSTRSASHIPGPRHPSSEMKPRQRASSTSLPTSPASRHTTPAAALSHRRAHDDTSMISDEGAGQPDLKRARHGQAEDTGEHEDGQESDVETDTGIETAEAASSVGSSQLAERKAGHAARSKGKHKAVEFTQHGIIPMSGAGVGSRPADPRVSPATKTTFTSTLTDPEGAIAMADVKHDTPRAHSWPASSVGGDAQHGPGTVIPPSASIAAEQLGAALAEDEAATMARSRSSEGSGHGRPAATHEQTRHQGEGQEHKHGHGPSTEEATKETEIVRASGSSASGAYATSSGTYPSADIAPLGVAPVAGSEMLPAPEEAAGAHPTSRSSDDTSIPTSSQSSPETHQGRRRKLSGPGFGSGVKQKMVHWRSKLRSTSREQREGPT
ncbi:hypothetical protein CF326_g331 [Tilletia indica]|nr:hypothetical protein CF326_g331 [Tilletia indica]